LWSPPQKTSECSGYGKGSKPGQGRRSEEVDAHRHQLGAQMGEAGTQHGAVVTGGVDGVLEGGEGRGVQLDLPARLDGDPAAARQVAAGLGEAGEGGGGEAVLGFQSVDGEPLELESDPLARDRPDVGSHAALGDEAAGVLEAEAGLVGWHG